MQGVMLAHGLATKTFCDDLVKQLKVYIPIHTGAQGTVQIKVCATMSPYCLHHQARACVVNVKFRMKDCLWLMGFAGL